MMDEEDLFWFPKSGTANCLLSFVATAWIEHGTVPGG